MPPTGQVRVTRRRAETRARLLEAAFEVFAAEGFGHSTIEAVCDRAGYTRGAFYSNFKDLDELFFALYDDRSAVIAGQLGEALAATGAVAEAADATLAELTARVTGVLLLDRDWLLVKTEFLLHAARRPDVARALADHRAVLHGAVAQRLSELASRNRPLPPALADADSAAHAVIALYDGVTVQLLLDGDVDAARAWLGRLITALLSSADTATPTEATTPHPEESTHGR
ncbi:TetR/AcrR family transcriptional regulator [Streptacidiphilus jiangxiensis]|uniref:DNA-binding transcriptional regulator, AcrR family n=1 Tax=Streptacidiphilus jiangxiensis TaxID=235985 RepID=A0A1H7YE06_STRJI|nr:TetR/AcrR family transcriptional regulator [Streptacidiphilus jiangxiensis]SEM44183.1 DNA-binding transcriptional regulator, AcrR family [Streptacidiphilus jiangxiensis]